MDTLENTEIKPINKKRLILIFLVIVIIASLAWVFFFKKGTENNIPENNILENSCFVEKQRTIDGTSMFPLFKNRETVTTFENYYDCNEIKEGDVVIFNFKTKEGDYIKRVMAMPNDLIEFEEGYIKINGEFVLNSEGNKYEVNTSQEKVLSIPLNNYQIPRNGYLVLGDNVSESTFDSRQFGYISEDQIIGKVSKQ